VHSHRERDEMERELGHGDKEENEELKITGLTNEC
jgi:hypothetical protein